MSRHFDTKELGKPRHHKRTATGQYIFSLVALHRALRRL